MVPARFHTSQLDLTTGLKVSVKTKFFCTIILRLGKIIKPFFLYISLPVVFSHRVTCKMLYRDQGNMFSSSLRPVLYLGLYLTLQEGGWAFL
jgi:hypothetical protein